MIKLTSQYVRMDAGSYQWQDQCFSSETAFEAHTHEFHEFFLVTEGVMRHWWNGREVWLRPGALQLMMPNDCHRVEPTTGGRVRLYNCNIKSEELRKIWGFMTGGEALLLSDLPQTVPSLSREVREALEEKMGRVVALQRAGEFGVEYTALSRSITQEVCCLLLRRAGRNTGAAMPPWLEGAMAAMRDQGALREGLGRLQREAARTPEHLSRSMRKYCGMTPGEWILEMRMREAERMLEEGDRTVGEVAMRVGMENLSYFRRVFRRRNNMTPREFRKKWQMR